MTAHGIDGTGSPVIAAFSFDGAGRGHAIDADEALQATPRDGGFVWLHLDRHAEETRVQIGRRTAGSPLLGDAMLQEETRPRVVVDHDSMLLILRGVNLNPGADPEDMVSVRIWIDAGQMITLRGLNAQALADLQSAIERGEAFRSPGELLVALAERLTQRADPVVLSMLDTLDELEEETLIGRDSGISTRVTALRLRAVGIRRYLNPQLGVYGELATLAVSWLDDDAHARFREVADRLARIVEGLDSARERAQVVSDELSARAQEQLNRNMYLLSLVTLVFLPLGFITGLLGVNVGGIPGTASGHAFWVLCIILTLVAVAMLGFMTLRRLW